MVYCVWYYQKAHGMGPEILKIHNRHNYSVTIFVFLLEFIGIRSRNIRPAQPLERLVSQSSHTAVHWNRFFFSYR